MSIGDLRWRRAGHRGPGTEGRAQAGRVRRAWHKKIKITPMSIPMVFAVIPRPQQRYYSRTRSPPPPMPTAVMSVRRNPQQQRQLQKIPPPNRSVSTHPRCRPPSSRHCCRRCCRFLPLPLPQGRPRTAARLAPGSWSNPKRCSPDAPGGGRRQCPPR